MRKLRIIALCLLVGLATGRLSGAQDIRYKIIVHPDNPVTSMSSAEISKLFLKQVTRWEDGTSVVPVDQPPSSGVRQRFCRDILKKSVSDVVAYWQEMVFAGRESPPPQRSSDLEVIAFVKNNPGAIGYVENIGTVRIKVLTVSDR